MSHTKFVFGPVSGETRGEYLERIQPPDLIDQALAGCVAYQWPTAGGQAIRERRSKWNILQRNHWNRTDLRDALRQDTDNILRRCKSQELTAADAEEQIDDAIQLDSVTADYHVSDDQLAEIVEMLKVKL